MPMKPKSQAELLNILREAAFDLSAEALRFLKASKKGAVVPMRCVVVRADGSKVQLLVSEIEYRHEAIRAFVPMHKGVGFVAVYDGYTVVLCADCQERGYSQDGCARCTPKHDAIIEEIRTRWGEKSTKTCAYAYIGDEFILRPRWNADSEFFESRLQVGDEFERVFTEERKPS